MKDKEPYVVGRINQLIDHVPQLTDVDDTLVLHQTSKPHIVVQPDNYDSLRSVFADAVMQASKGKGAERHATENEPFDKQQICQIPRWQGSTDGLIYQSVKKALEAKRLPNQERRIAELLGSINYLAAAVIVEKEKP